MIAKKNLNLDKNENLKPYKRKYTGMLNFKDNNNISNDPKTIKVGDLLIWNGQELSQDFLRTKTEVEREEIAKDVYNFWKKYDFNNIQFDEKNIENGWKALCKFKPKVEIVDGIKYVSNSGTSGNAIYRNYFPNIIKVRGESRPSIYDVLTNEKTLFDVCLNRIGNTLLWNDDPTGIKVQYPMPQNLSQITIGAKNSGLSSMASIFKPTVSKAIYSQYVKDGDNVLDYSAGFGGRLMGLMSLQLKNVKYCAYEPNTMTFNSLLEMIERFKFNAEIKCSGSEADDLFKDKFSFVFSSPPYHNIEKYCDEETQCYNKYPEYNEWLENYWRKTVQNVKQMINPEAVFGINCGGQANPIVQKLEEDFRRVIVEEGFELIDTIWMKTSKSHLSGKKSKNEKHKLEGCFFYKLI